MSTYIDDLALEASERYVQTSQDPSEIIAEIANRNDLNSEQIKRLVEKTNRAIFLKMFEHKLHEFPIASFERVMSYLHDKITEPIPVVEKSEDWYDWNEYCEVDPQEVLRQYLPIAKNVEPDLKPEKYKIVLISLTQMRKAANDFLAESMRAKADLNELVDLTTEALQWVTPKMLKDMLMQKAPKENKKEYEMLVDQIINSAVKKQEQKQAPRRGSAKKVACYIATVAGKRCTYSDVAKKMAEENVTPEEVINALHEIYNTTVFDYIVEKASKTKEAVERFDTFIPIQEKITTMFTKISSVLNSLKKMSELADEIELYHQTAQESAISPELNHMVAREWAKISKRQIVNLNKEEN